MQDGYAGDMGDYGKFALLRAIARTTELRLGLHWWLTSAGGRPNDGRHTTYLTTPRGERRYRPPDPNLYDALRSIVTRGTRTVAALQEAALIRGPATYFAERLDYDGIPLAMRVRHREAWLARAVETFTHCDVVLLDPDNGLEVTSTGIRAQKAPKYVFIHEARELAGRRSVIVYQHLDRSGKAADQMRRRMRQLAIGSEPFVVRHHRGTGRAYLFLPAPEHRNDLRRAADVLLATWPRDFTLVA